MTNLQELFADGRPRQIPKGQIVIYEGDPITNLYFLDSGYVKVYNILEEGTERILFLYGPGDIFPMTSFLSGTGVTRYFYECLNDVQVRLVKSENLQAKIRGNLELGEALIDYADSMNQQFAQRINMLSATNARNKIVDLLGFLTDKVGSKDSSQLTLPLTAQNIADMCGLTRETTTKKLGVLKREGIVLGFRPLVIDAAKLRSKT